MLTVFLMSKAPTANLGSITPLVFKIRLEPSEVVLLLSINRERRAMGYSIATRGRQLGKRLRVCAVASIHPVGFLRHT